VSYYVGERPRSLLSLTKQGINETERSCIVKWCLTTLEFDSATSKSRSCLLKIFHSTTHVRSCQTSLGKLHLFTFTNVQNILSRPHRYVLKFLSHDSHQSAARPDTQHHNRRIEALYQKIFASPLFTALHSTTKNQHSNNDWRVPRYSALEGR
jgi:hypothetical protein